MSKKHIFSQVLFHLIFWIFTSYFIIDFFSLESEEININMDGNTIIERNHNPFLQQFLMIGVFFRMLFFYGHIKWLSPPLFSKKLPKYLVYLLTLLAGCILLELSGIYIIGNIPWNSLIRMLTPIYVFYFLASLIYMFFRRWQDEEDRKKAIKNQLLQSELKALRSQFDPHFIFNTLNSLLFIAEKEGSNEISTAIEEMSSLMRSVIYDFKSETIPLSREVELISKYINLQLLKYDDQDDIYIHQHIDENVMTDEVLIAPLTLLPFVENAIKHGVSIYERSEISITAQKSDGQLTFAVSNTLHDNGSPKHNGIGLENITKRLELLYPEHHSLHIETEEKYTITLKLDLNHQPLLVI